MTVPSSGVLVLGPDVTLPMSSRRYRLVFDGRDLVAHHNDDADIVGARRVEAELQEGLAGAVRPYVTECGRDLGIVGAGGQPVAANEEGIVGCNVDDACVNADGRIDADGTGDDVTIG
jgi:hypothetical protein